MLTRNESSAKTISDVIIIAVRPPESPRNGIIMTKPYNRKDKNKNNNPSFFFEPPGAAGRSSSICTGLLILLPAFLND